MADKIKLGVAFLLVAAGIAGFYALHESAAVVKLAVVLLGLLLVLAGLTFSIATILLAQLRCPVDAGVCADLADHVSALSHRRDAVV